MNTVNTMNTENLGLKNILLCYSFYKSKHNLPNVLLKNIGLFLQEKLYKCDDCPAITFTKEQFKTEKSFLDFKKKCPDLCQPLPSKLPKYKLTKCSYCKNLLCYKHATRALHWGKHYRNNKSLMCDSCCWNENS